MKLKCLIVDDEPSGRKILEEFINEVDYLELIGKVSDSLEALVFLNQNLIDLIFLDIQMPKLNGIDFLKNLKSPPMIVFTTAYPEYAVKGFDLEVVDYLLKPISNERFLKACTKALDCFNVYNGKNHITHGKDFFFVKCNNFFEKVFFSELLFIEAASNYVLLHTKNKRLLVYLTLKMIEEQLAQDKFVKVHKSFIVAIDKIESINGVEIKILNHIIPISKNFRENTLNRIVNNTLIKR